MLFYMHQPLSSIPLSYQYDYAWQPNPDNPSININPNERGKGYGKILLNNGIKEFSYENKTAKYLNHNVQNIKL